MQLLFLLIGLAFLAEVGYLLVRERRTSPQVPGLGNGSQAETQVATWRSSDGF